MVEESKELDFYYTINEFARDEIKVKSSKFIASVAPANTKQEALDFLTRIRAEFYDATHNCYAFLIGEKGMDFRAADDGEPNGSAGKPILFSIKKFDYKDIIVVVTRYYGGTKLGVGGLVRAYSEAAELALEKTKKKKIDLTLRVKVNCTYEDIDIIKRMVGETAVSFDEHYADAIEILANIHRSKAQAFCEKVVSQTRARAGAVIQNDKGK
jgi:uncharacterized YigZ family protein